MYQYAYTLYNQTCGIVQTLNKSNLPPLLTSRQCPAHPFWVPTHANKEHDHRKTQLSMPHDSKAISKTGSLGSCIVSKDIGSNERMTMQNLLIHETAEIRNVPKRIFPPRFPDKDRFTSRQPPRFCAGYSHRCKNTNTTN